MRLSIRAARAFAVGVALAGPAAAQPAFSPPLDAPTPIESPISFALAPGASVDCAGFQSVEGAQLPAPPETRIRIAVDAAEGGVRLRLIDLAGSNAEIAVFAGDDGRVAIDPTSDLGAFEGVDQATLAAVAAQIPELKLHRRTFGQEDPLYTPDELEAVFERMFAEMAGPGVRPDISGGSYLRGASSLDGAEMAVFRGAIELADPSLGLRVVVNNVEVFDTATGLRVFSETVIRIPAPPALDVPEVIVRQRVSCAPTQG